MVNTLEQEFTGIGEVAGFKFKQIEKSKFAFIYEVKNCDKIYYEVFERILAPVCVDFNKRIYSETEFKEVYPKSSNFGVSAWTIRNKEKAYLKYNKLNNLK